MKNKLLTSITVIFWLTLTMNSSELFAKNGNNNAEQSKSWKVPSPTNNEISNLMVGSDGIMVPVPVVLQDRVPSCDGNDMGGGLILNHITTCCAVVQDAEGRSVCVGYETCSVYSMNCLGDDGYYPVNGDPFDCSRDDMCDANPSGGGGQIQETLTN